MFSVCFTSTAMAQETKIVYTCPMHPNVQKDKPANCPICGMTLEKKTITVKKAKSQPQKGESKKPSPHKETKMPASMPMGDTAKPMHHDHMNMQKAADTTKPTLQMSDSMNMGGMNMQGMDMSNPMSHHMNMSHSYSLNLPMNRNGSGTGCLPDASPMFGYMFQTPKWMYMLHGNFFLRYNNQDFTNKGSRGDSKLDVPDWLMFMGQRQVGKNGLFHFSVMSSLDAVFGGNAGYPLLFQSGEAYKGKSIVDRQHPHDLFSELSVSYSQALSKKADVFAYVGYPGEPALGPVAFMHRPSALANPDAPISHHWVDATHVTFGVATLGVRYGQFKIEGSSFTGREPDENRYDFDKARFDSWSGRLK